MSIPGVQMPHCAPPVSRNACWSVAQRPRSAQALHRRDRAPRRLADRDQAGVDHGSVEQDAARAALALAAALLRAGQPEVLAQHVEQAAAPVASTSTGSPLTREGEAHRVDLRGSVGAAEAASRRRPCGRSSIGGVSRRRALSSDTAGCRAAPGRRRCIGGAGSARAWPAGRGSRRRSRRGSRRRPPARRRPSAARRRPSRRAERRSTASRRGSSAGAARRARSG